MKRANLVVTACLTALLGAVGVTSAHAQDFTGMEKSILTFSAPVELPGLTLQPGTYVFKRPDPNTARVIRVFSEDEKTILGQFLTIPTRRLQVTKDNVVTFKENREGMTPAVHYWYYPGKESGHEFVYPKDQAMRIAARTGERVLSTEGDINANSTVTPIEGSASKNDSASNVVNGSGVPSADSSATTASNITTPEPDVNVNRQGSASTATADTQIASAPVSDRDDQSSRDAVGTSGAADANTQATDNSRKELPRTASPLPLVGLIGLLAFAGAVTLRRARV